MVKKAREALGSLDRWLQQTTHSSSSSSSHVGESSGTTAITTQVLLSDQPSASRNAYREQKTILLSGLHDKAGQTALEHANEAVLSRMRRIDRLAAEKGMEVGGEGGERTGLSRVERAVRGSKGGDGGLLGLLEGSGLEG
jgi:hypothetical protein